MRTFLRSYPARFLLILAVVIAGLTFNQRSALAAVSVTGATFVNGTVVVTFSGPVICFGGSCQGFAVVYSSGTAVTVSSATVNPTNLTQIVLTLSPAPDPAAQLYVSYSPGNVQDTAGGPVQGFPNIGVTNPTSTTPGTPGTPVATATPLPVTVSVAPPAVVAGTSTTVTVNGTGFAGGETVTASYTGVLNTGGSVVESVIGQAKADGTISLPNLAVPANVAAGQYTVNVQGQTSRASGAAILTVLPQPATPAPTVPPLQGTILPPPPPPAPVTATPTFTPTPLPTPTFTPTATATPVPPGIGSIVLQPLVGKTAVKSAKVGQIVNLRIAVTVTSTPAAGNLSVSWQIVRNGKTVNHHGRHTGLLASQTGQFTFDWYHKFDPKGTYTITVTTKLEGAQAQKTVSFKVT